MAAGRADAQRNRQALVDAAAVLFVERGAAVPLDEVAKAAGVSIATLYRNFSTREDLVAATYRREIDHLVDTESLLVGGVDGATALTAWIDRLVDYSATKRAIAEILHGLPTSSRPPARDAVVAALTEVLAAGADDGTLRRDLDADDVLALLSGLWSLAPGGDAAERARRLGRFVADGLRAERQL
ncbi:TetR/AcrR family transcriptional regulator [Jatrophihabitans sp. YIM 134969]